MCTDNTHDFRDSIYPVLFGPIPAIILEVNFIMDKASVEPGGHDATLFFFTIDKISFLSDRESSKSDGLSILIEEDVGMSTNKTLL